MEHEREAEGSQAPLRLGLVMAAVAAAGALVAGVLLNASTGALVALVVGAGGLMYGATHVMWARRLARADALLHALRDQRFEAFADDAPPPAGDELSRLLASVHRTGQRMQQTIRELKQMEHYRREFIGNVSHELKTPIFTVQGFTETLLDGALNDPTVNRVFLEKILRNVQRLDHLARDLSDIARIETGALEMSAAPFEANAVVREVVESLEMKADQKDIVLHSALPGDPLVAYGDRERIRQVVLNLTDNAIKYTESGGHVTVRVQAAEEQVRFAVADDGIGIAPEHIERLTERFYRVDKSRSRNQGGTGLGLAIVKHILGAHNQTLHVESAPGEGSTFSFALAAASTRQSVGVS
ncbi:sensor histidine kinase [Salisaeta longa]|uniref:sensor histidine kinase n=1 Tax=Salisaeta longa TaxID=503170 RepID=UPI0003B7B40C|nr:ATP-binding protein [Salisaeta longa]